MPDGIVRIKVGWDGSEAEKGVGKVEDRLEGLKSKADKVSSALTSVGSALTVAVTAPIVATGGAAVKAATEIDSSLTSVRKTVDGTAEEYAALKDAAIEFSKTNAVSAADILAIQSLGAQLGFTIDELQEFGEVASGLDIATNMDAETASTQMAQFANIVGMSHDDIRRYASTIVELGNNMATTESDISNMAMRIAGAGHQVGLSTPEILGLSAALTSMGVSAEAGGTAISTIMSTIDKNISLTTPKAQAMTETWAEAWKAAAGNEGKSTEDFRKAWSQDVVGTLSDVLAGMESTVDSGGNMSVMLDELGISSIRQTDVMKRLASNSEFLGKAIGYANDGWNENIALDKEVANRNDSIAAKFTILKNKATAVLNTIGEPLADALLDIIDAAQPLIEQIQAAAEWFANLDEKSQRTILSLAAAAAAVGPLTAGLGKMISVGGNVLSLFTKSSKVFDEAGKVIGTKLTPNIKTLVGAGVLGAVITVLSIVIPLIVDAVEHSQTLSKATDGLRNAVVNAEGAMSNAQQPMKDYRQRVKDITSAADDCIQKTADLAQSITDGWTDVLSNEYKLDGYMKTIEELGGKEGLTKDEQLKLKDAVDGYNSITGDSLKVLDPQNGLLSDQIGILRENADAWKDRARAEAAATNYSNVLAQQMETERVMKETYALLEEEVKTWGDGTMTVEQFLDSSLSSNFEPAKRYKELLATYEALGDASEYWLGMMVELDAEMQTQEAEVDKVAEEVKRSIRAHNNYGDVLRRVGNKDIDEFIGWLHDLGLTEDGIAALTDEDLDAIAKAYEDTSGNVGNSLDAIVAKANEAGAAAPIALAEQIEENGDVPVEAAGKVADDVESEFDSIKGEVAKKGLELVQGYANSIRSNAGLAADAANAAVRQTLASMAAAQRSASPSKEAMKLGNYLSEGYAEGIEDSSKEAIVSAADLATEALSAMQIDNALGGINWYSTSGNFAAPEMLFGGQASPILSAMPAVTGGVTSAPGQSGDEVSFYGDMVFNVAATDPQEIAREVLGVVKTARYNYGRR